jgi:hypothetical protein
MYLTTTARSLGDGGTVTAPTTKPRHPKESCAKKWREWKAANPKNEHPWANFLRSHQKCAKHLHCGENRLHGGQIVVIDCPAPKPPALGSAYYLGTSSACADAGTGMLADCWRAAVAKGLSGVDQATLTRLSTAYQRLTRPDRLAGWERTSRGMQWRGMSGVRLGSYIYTGPMPAVKKGQRAPTLIASGTLGDLPLYAQPATDASYDNYLEDDPVAAPDPLTISPARKPPTWLTSFQAQLPLVSASALLQAAQLPNAPGIVRQAAAQLPAQSWFTQSMIGGIPNYLLLGGGGLLLLLAAGGKRRR